jgi:YD repeat-containing protein
MVAIVSGNSLGLNLTSLSTLGRQGVNGTASEGANGEQAYVNAATGNLILHDLDDHLVGHGIAIDTVRTYNSQAQFAGGSADNWSAGIMRKSAVLTGTINKAGSSITRTDEDGARSVYTYNNALGVYVSADGDGAYDTIAKAGKNLVWTDGTTGRTETYDSNGVLQQTADPQGNKITYSYYSSGALAGLLQSATDASGETVYFDYAANRTLTQVRTVIQGTNSQQTVTRAHYEYDAQNRLTKAVVDLTPDDNSTSDGKVFTTTYTYDGSSARIASIVQSDGTKLSFTYTWDGSNYRVASVTDGVGQVTRFAYDTAARKTTVADPLNQITTYEYDAGGQLVKVTRPTADGSSLVTSFTYNANGDVIRIVDGAGHAVDMQYDANGNQTLQRDSAGNTIVRTFNAMNQTATETVYAVADPDGSGPLQPSQPLTTRYVYDASVGNLLRFVISAEGRVTEYRYNGAGERTSTIQYTGAAYNVAALAQAAVPTEGQMQNWAKGLDQTQALRTDMIYDLRGQLKTQTTFAKLDSKGNGVVDGNQSVVNYVFDQAGLLRQTVDANGGMTSYAYDGLGRLLSATDAQNGVTFTTYDDKNHATKTVFANGLATTSIFNAAGQLTGVAQSGLDGATLGQTSYVYDANGRLRMTVDPTGQRSYVLYDAAGRKVADIDASGALVEYRYNGADQIAKTIRYVTKVDLRRLTDASGNPANIDIAALRPALAPLDRTSWSSYDTAGRLIKTVDALGYVTQFDYDGAGRAIAAKRYATAIDTTVLSGIPAPADINPVASAADRVTRSFYDKDGKLLGQLDAEGFLTEYRYDAGGRLMETIAYSVATPAAQRAQGTLSDLRPASDTGAIHQYNLYDGKGLLAATVDGMGYLTEFAYDKNGNLTSKTRYGNVVTYTASSTLLQLRAAAGTNTQVTTRTYTALNQLATETVPDGTTAKYAYDTVGNLVSVVRAYGTLDARTSLKRYDLQGRLVAELSAEGADKLAGLTQQSAIDAVWNAYATTYQYDADGHRIRMTDALGHSTSYYYDEAGRLAYTINAAGEVEGRAYTTLGQLASLVHYAMRLDAQLAGSLTGGKADGALQAALSTLGSGQDAVQYFDYDKLGRTAVQRDVLGDSTFDYNAFGELKSSSERIDATHVLQHTYAYDRRGLRTETRWDPAGANTAEQVRYDAFGRQVDVIDAAGNKTSTSYDRLGRIVLVTGALGETQATTYDAFDRVLSQTDNRNNKTTYQYDTPNRRITITTAEGFQQTIEYNRHGQQVALTDANGNVTKFEYDRNGHLVKTTDGLGQSVKNAYDNAGRLASVTDANGNVTKFEYDVVDRILKKTIAVPGGTDLTTQYTYDAQGRVLTVTDPNGIVTQTAYDVRGQVTSVTVDPVTPQNPQGLNLQTRFDYDGRGKVLRVTDPNGHVTQYKYDALGRRIQQIVDPDGLLRLQTDYAYDLNGNVTQVTDPNGHVTRYVIGAENRVSYQIDADGGVVHYEYDQDGRVTRTVRYAKAIDLSGLPSPLSATDVEQNLKTDPADTVQTNVYDKDGRLVYMLDGTGSVTQRIYDGNGNVVRTVSFAKTLPAGTAATVDALRDAVKLIADPARDMATVNVYDAANRVTRQVAPGGAVTVWRYDANGNAIERLAYSAAIDVTQLPERPLQSDIDRLIAVDDRTDQHQRMVYDAANRLIGTAIAQGVGADGSLRWAVVRQTADNDGNIVSRTQYATLISSKNLSAGATQADVGAWIASVAVSTQDHTARMAYDRAGRLVYTIDASNAVTQQVYDKAGNVIQRIAYAQKPALAGMPSAETIADALIPYAADAENVSTRTIYDAANRAIYAIDAENNLSEMRYDGVDNLTATIRYADTDARLAALDGHPDAATIAQYVKPSQYDRIERRAYDGDNHLRYTIDAEGYVSETSYDALGRVIDTVQYANKVALDDMTPSANKISDILQRDAVHDRVNAFAYDAHGNLASSIDPLGFAESWTYDALGHKLSFTNKLGATWDYDYDAAGRLKSERAPQTAIVRIDLDRATGQFTETTANVRSETRIDYDAFGNVKARTEGWGQPDARITRYEYDAAGRQVKTIFPDVPVYDAEHDDLLKNGANGNAARVEQTRTPATTVVYDAFGNAVSSTDAAGNVSRKVYDKLGRVVYDIDAAGYVTGYSRDTFGQVTQLTRYAQRIDTNAFGAGPQTADRLKDSLRSLDSTLNRVIETAYDRMGRSVRVTEPQSYTWNGQDGYVQQRKVTEMRYDAFGGLIEQREHGQNVEGARSFFEYDRRGLKTAQFDFSDACLGYVTTFAYDGAGNMIGTVEYADPTTAALDAQQRWHLVGTPAADSTGKDRAVSYEYDVAGRMVGETRINAAYSDKLDGSSTTGNLVTRYGYDALGNRTSVTDALGNVSYTYYDALGRISAIAAPSAQTRTRIVQLYAALFGRAPDLSGLAYWTGKLAAGETLGKVAQDIINVVPASSNLSDGDFLNSLYRNATGHDADADGLAYWKSQLASRSRGEVVEAFIGSLLAPQSTDAGSASQQTFNGKVQAAMPETEAASSLTPITEFKRDIYGNVTKRIDHAQSASAATVTGYTVADDAGNDRVTRSAFDAHGHEIATEDAEKHKSFASFDALGRLTKQWQTVTDAFGVQHTAFTVKRYDAVGQLIETIEPGQAKIVPAADGPGIANGAIDQLVHRKTQYNAFGEATAKTVDLETQQRDTAGNITGGSTERQQSEYDDYDNAGHLWRTNAGDGVTRVFLSDIDGRVASTLTSAGTDLHGAAINSAAIAAAQGGLTRVDTRYDRLGHVVEQRLPTITVQQDAVSTAQRAYIDATITGNKLQFAWSDLSMLGSGDIQVVVEYLTTKGEVKTVSIPPLDGGQYAHGGSVEWNGPAIEQIVSIKVSKKDVTGHWQEVLRQGADATYGNLVEIDAPQDFGKSIVLQYRLAGSDKCITAELADFGGRYAFNTAMLDTDKLAAGHYEYQVLEVDKLAAGATPEVRETGTFTAGAGDFRTLVAQLYTLLFNRAPDADGMAYWVAQLAQTLGKGSSLADFVQSMFDSGRVTGAYTGIIGADGVIDYAALVRGIYAGALGRTPPDSEVTYWADRLAADPSGKVGSVLLDLLDAVVLYDGTDPSALTSQKLFANKVAVGKAYAVTFGGGIADAARVLSLVTADSVDQAIKAAKDSVSQPYGIFAREVAQLYVLLFDRAPDAAGLQYWVTRLQGSQGVAPQTLTQVAQAMFDSGRATGAIPSDITAEEIVRQIYMGALGRAPEAEALAYWSGRIGSSSVGSTALAIIDSVVNYRGDAVEAQMSERLFHNKVDVALAYASGLNGNDPAQAADVVRKVTVLDTTVALTAALGYAGSANADNITIAQLYVLLFNRAPEADGFAYWKGQLAGGVGTAAVAQHIIDAVPAIGALSNADFVKLLYRNGAERDADAEGLAYWTGQLATLSRGEVATAFAAALAAEPSGTASAEAIGSHQMFLVKVAAGLTYAMQNGNDVAGAANIVAGAVADRNAALAAVAATEAKTAADLAGEQAKSAAAQAAKAAVAKAAADVEAAAAMSALANAQMEEAAAAARDAQHKLEDAQKALSDAQRAAQGASTDADAAESVAKEAEAAWQAAAAVAAEAYSDDADAIAADAKVKADLAAQAWQDAYQKSQDALSQYQDAGQTVLLAQQERDRKQAAYENAVTTAGTAAGAVELAQTAYAAAQTQSDMADRVALAAVSNRTKVVQLYALLFNKSGSALDITGVDYWTGQLNLGRTFAQLAQDMYVAGGLSVQANSSVVHDIYTGAFGRTVTDTAGEAYWADQLNKAGQADGRPSKGDVFVDMINGVLGYTGSDAAALASQASFSSKTASSTSWLANQQSSLSAAAQTAYTTQQSAQKAYDTANAAIGIAYTTWQTALAAYNNAQQTVQKAQDEVDAKQAAYNTAFGNYTTAYNSYQAALGTYNAAQAQADMGNRIGAASTAMRTEISQLYVLLFNKSGSALDIPGVDYWIGQLNSGKSFAQVAQDMYNSGNSSSTANGTLVHNIYANAFGRATTDSAAESYWTDQLNNVGLAGYPATKGDVFVAMINAVVNYSGGDSSALSAKSTFNGKVNGSLSWLTNQQVSLNSAAQTAYTNLQSATSSYNTALANYKSAASALSTAQTNYSNAVNATQAALTDMNNKLAAYNSAKASYDNAKVPSDYIDRIMAASSLYRTQMAQGYALLFNKSASAVDLQGADYWIGRLSAIDFAGMVGEMYVAGGLSSQANSTVIHNIFMSSLGRTTTDAGGEAYWTGQLDNAGSDEHAKGQVFVSLLGTVSTYAGSDPVGAASRDTYNAKVNNTLSYLSSQKAPLDNATQAAYNTYLSAKSAYDSAQSTYNTDVGLQSGAQNDLSNKQSAYNTAYNTYTSAQTAYNTATTTYNSAKSLSDAADRIAAAAVPVRSQVSQLYVLLFNKSGSALDIPGVDYWIDQRNAGNSFGQIAQDMYTAGGLSSTANGTLVHNIYANAFGRATTDSAAESYWTDQLNNVGLAGYPATKGDVFVAMINAVVNYSGGDSSALSAQSTFNGKVNGSLSWLTNQQVSLNSAAQTAWNALQQPLSIYNDASATLAAAQQALKDAQNALAIAQDANALLADANNKEIAYNNAVKAANTATTTLANAQTAYATAQSDADRANRIAAAGVAYRTEVTELYALLLNQSGSALNLADVDNWIAQRGTGKSFSQIAQDMYAAGGLSAVANATLVHNIFTNALGRTALDSAGEAYWTDQLNNVGQTGYPATKGDVFVAMIGAVVNYTGSDPVSLSSRGTFNGKVNGSLSWLDNQQVSLNNAARDAWQALQLAQTGGTTAGTLLDTATRELNAAKEALRLAQQDQAAKLGAWTLQQGVTEAALATKNTAADTSDAAAQEAGQADTAARTAAEAAAAVADLSATQLAQARTRVAQLYALLLNRSDIDTAGMNYWVAQLAAGKTLGDVAYNIYTSANLAGVPNSQLVHTIYTTSMGRTEPDEAGEAYWSGQLDHAGEAGYPASKGDVFATWVGLIVNYTGTDLASLTSRKLITEKVAASLSSLAGQDAAQAVALRAAITAANTTLTQAQGAQQQAAQNFASAFDAVHWSDVAVPATASQTTVAQLYTLLFNRAPDADGLAYWSGQLDARGGDAAAVLDDMMTAGGLASLSNAALIHAIYSGALGRTAPDAAGEAYWTGQLNNAGQPGSPPSRAAALLTLLHAVADYSGIDAAGLAARGVFNNKVAAGLVYAATLSGNDPDTARAVFDAVTPDSAAAAIAAAVNAIPDAANRTTLAQLYVALLGKSPDLDGFRYWVGQREQGIPAATVAQHLVDAAPAVAALSDADFIQALYRNAFGTAPDAPALAYWTGQAAGKTRGALALQWLGVVAGYTGLDPAALAHQRTFDARVAQALGDVLAAADAAAGQAGTARDAQLKRATDAARAAAAAAAAAFAADAAADTALDATRSLRVFDPAKAGIGNGRVTHLGWTAQRVRTTGEITPTVALEADRWGNVLSSTDVRNAAWVTRYAYDADNRLTETARPDGSGIAGQIVTRTAYDALGRQVATVDGNGHFTALQLDAQGNTVEERHADGGTVAQTFDALGNRTSRTDTLGHTTTYGYDRLGHLTASTAAATEVFASSALMQSVGTAEDPRFILGRVLATDTGRHAQTERWDYDELGRRIRHTDGAGAVDTTAYDLAGQVTGTIDATGAGTASVYDGAGRKVSETDGNGHTQTWRYDAASGKLVRHTDLSNQATRFDYDLAGHLVHQTADGGQNLRYTYDAAGRLARIDDTATGTTTAYAYDAAGNRLTETTVKAGQVLQDNHLAWDALGRLRLVGDSRYSVRYDYDAAGNRIHSKTSYIDEAGAVQEREEWNAFNEMNRQTIVAGTAVKDADGRVIRVVRDAASAASHEIAYDSEGNRITDTFHGSAFVQDDPHADPVTRHLEENREVKETYVYDERNRLTATWRDGVQYDYRRYDAAGRMVMSGLHQGDLLTEWFGSLQQLGLSTDSRFYLYDAAGREQIETVRGLQGEAATTNLQYRYDGAGNLASYTLTGGGQGSKTYRYTYRLGEGYQVCQIDADGNGGTGKTVNHYDVNGHLERVEVYQGGTLDDTQTRVLDNDVEGHALRMMQNGQVTHTLIVNGQELGSSGTGREDDGFADYRKVDGSYGTSPSGYTIQAGDEKGDAVSTLRAIAQTVWGDATQWYLIAEANGVQGTADLAAGKVITIPGRSTAQMNNADSFRAYDAHKLLGDTTPSLPNPAADEGCGAVGQILTTVVAIAVALVVTAVTEDPQAGLSSWQAFTTALANAGAGAAAAGAAAGNLAGQVVGNAAGVRDGFSWQEVALSAVGGGISGGLSSTTFSGNVVANAALKAGIANALTQGVAVVTGLQEHFDWRGVVASAVGNGVGAGVSEALGGTFGQGFAGSLARGTVSGLAAGLTTAALRGGAFSVGQVARDAFGNALGNSIVDNMRPSYSDEEMAQDFAHENGRFASKATADMDARFAEVTANSPLLAQHISKNGWSGDVGSLQIRSVDDDDSALGYYRPELLPDGARNIGGARVTLPDGRQIAGFGYDLNGVRQYGVMYPAGEAADNAWFAQSDAHLMRQRDVSITENSSDIDRAAQIAAVASAGEFAVLSDGLSPDIASGYAGPARVIADPLATTMIETKAGPRMMGVAGVITGGFALEATVATGSIPVTGLVLDQMYASAKTVTTGEPSPTFVNLGLQKLGATPTQASAGELALNVATMTPTAWRINDAVNQQVRMNAYARSTYANLLSRDEPLFGNGGIAHPVTRSSGNLVLNKFPGEKLDPTGKIYGVARSVNGQVVIDRSSLPRNVDFVVTTDGQLVLGQKHTTLANNADVLAAGQMTLSGKGKIRLIDNLSGHYQPTVEQGLRVPSLLNKLGYDTSGTYLKLYDFAVDADGFVTGRNLAVNRQLP